MAIFLVSYDLNKETVRPQIVEEVKKSPGWAPISESSYAIDTSETALAVYERFKKHLDANDTFYVISLRKPYAGYGFTNVNDWLERNLPDS